MAKIRGILIGTFATAALIGGSGAVVYNLDIPENDRLAPLSQRKNMDFIKGNDYARLGQTDAATAIGLREALNNAGRRWATLPPEEQTRDRAIDIMKEACLLNDLLVSAGTSEIVARFFERRMQKQPEQNVLDFADSLAQITSFFHLQPKLNDNNVVVLALAGAFTVEAAQEYMGVPDTLTEIFIRDLQSESEHYADIKITPQPFTPGQVTQLSDLDWKFRFQDRTFTRPAVQQYVAPFEELAERKLSDHADRVYRYRYTLTGDKAPLFSTGAESSYIPDDTLSKLQKARMGMGSSVDNYRDVYMSLSGLIHRPAKLPQDTSPERDY